jgi:CheY-like chemotaxis protein
MPDWSGRLEGPLLVVAAAVATSSHSRDKQTATELGATAFITKPSDYKTLRKILSSVAATIDNGFKSTTDKLG